MALDPSIILSGKQAQLPDLGNLVQLRNLALRGQNEQLQLDANTKSVADEATLAGLYKRYTKPDGTVDAAGMQAGLSEAGLGAQIPKFQQAAAATRKAGTDAESSDIDLQTKKLSHVGSVLGALIQKPDLSHNDAIGAISSLVDQKWITNEQGAQMVQSLPGPGQLRQFIVSKAMETQDFEKQLRAKYDEQDRGGVISQGTIDPITGVRTETGTVEKTATPGEKLTDVRMRANAAATAAKGYSEDEGALLGAMAEAGISIPAGLRSKEQIKATVASLLKRNPDLTPDEIAQKIGTGQIEFKAEGKALQVAAAQAGKVSLAAKEITKFSPLVLAASAAVPRGSFVPWSKLRQMTNAQISDPALLQFKAQMTSLNNAYDQLAARGGTDKDKRAHTHELFETANSHEAVVALTQALAQEGIAAEEAASESMKRGAHATDPAPAATTTATGAKSNW